MPLPLRLLQKLKFGLSGLLICSKRISGRV